MAESFNLVLCWVKACLKENGVYLDKELSGMDIDMKKMRDGSLCVKKGKETGR